MNLHVTDEFSPLKKVAVHLGHAVPKYEDYQTTDPQELKWGYRRWDKDLLLKQQSRFVDALLRFGVTPVELSTTSDQFWHLLYTRDMGFVVGDTLFFADKRTLIARNGEIKLLFQTIDISKDKRKAIPGRIEGGDVLVHNSTAFVGMTNRTDHEALSELSKHMHVKPFHLGDNVMHLDTVLTLLPRNYALACLDYFSEEDRAYLTDQFTVIPVTKQERETLGTNVLVINPETIFVEERQNRIQNELLQAGFNIEPVSYSEPIVFGGSFRCTTLPLVRED